MGLGYEFSKRILGGGGRVFIADIDTVKGQVSKDELNKQYGEGKVEFGKLDVTNREEWRHIWAQAEDFFKGQVQGFCNNAGIFNSNWSKMLEINLDGMMVGAMLAYEKMGVSGGGEGGVMVVTGSLASFLCGWPTMEKSVYNVTKHGVVGLVRSQAEGSPVHNIDKVRTVAICPAFVNTQLVRNEINPTEFPAIKKKFGFGVLKPEEVACMFEKLVVKGRSGDMVVMFPGIAFVWPDWHRHFLKVFVVATKLAQKLLGVGVDDLVTSRDLATIIMLLLLVLVLFVHVALSWIGL